ncbi:MAG: hypothetical protein ACRDKH_04630 [Solirubrobacterales bacterium]
MTEKLFGRGRRGGVLLIAGAVLGAAIAGPGATIAQKAMNFNQATADKRYVKRTEVRQAGAIEEASVPFTSATFAPVVSTTIKTPGPGFLTVNGSLSAKAQGMTTSKLQYRLVVGTTPLSAAPQSFELFLPGSAVAGLANERQNGSANGFVVIPRKGAYDVQLQAQVGAAGQTVDVLGRSVNAVFTPKVKVGKRGKKKGKKPSGGGNAGP